MKRYPKISDNEIVQPTRRGYRMACCDCRLVHDLDFFVVKYGSRGQFTKQGATTELPGQCGAGLSD